MWSIYLVASVLLTILYGLLMARYLYHWNKIPIFEPSEDFQPNTQISILIPARNEAANIEECVRTVFNQSYPTELFEVIVVDDHSTDDTLGLLQQLAHQYSKLQIIQLKDFVKGESIQSHKKKAIETAIGMAKGQLILTTDADCRVPTDWLRFHAAYYQTHRKRFIAAPVNFFREKSLLERFQSLDFLGMMGITGAGIQGRFMRMCNGANLAYERETFELVGGFSGIDHLASGDDMLLMQKVAARFPDSIGYIKNPLATVQTKAQPTYQTFVQQRIRWGSKSGSYHEWQVIAMLGVVFLFCCNILFSLVLIPFIGYAALWLFLMQLLGKSIADYALLGTMAHFFDRRDLLSIFFPAQLMHTLYIVVVGTLSNLKKEYHWKGRKVR
ncbi:MAG: glycosyltransferase [Bacteroidota bacterium]